ncbi:outer membrane protein assembly factor BamE domain-containing protein [Noviherbaspirillum massiliense]|uniref:outer membrane protein assembly factor BamE domain-containing protein n=1 Tax=Noviherbaspirillum massiliense TaxID=1465823 RepID=UPI0002F4C067|nr:outer membrane protein assembly factor BamE [Noviherbaspirillum massiliense]
MKHAFQLLSASLLAACLASCASLLAPPVQPGEAESEVIARLGKPTHTYKDGQERLLEYMQGPFGQMTYMARIGADGRLKSYEQVLTSQRFASIKPGEVRKEDVLKTVGAPSLIQHFSATGLEAWSYPYKEDNAWDSMMTVYFDQAGVVRKLENGPDPRRMGNDNPKD